jgi:large subunit ribosomal protein L19
MKTNVAISPVDMQARKDLSFNSGDTIRVWTKIVEKGKTREQAFEGIVIARKHGAEAGATFTVRKVSNGVGVERIFPLYSPNIMSVEVVKHAKTRRSKLYYIRTTAARAIRRKLKTILNMKDKAVSAVSDIVEDIEEEIKD